MLRPHYETSSAEISNTSVDRVSGFFLQSQHSKLNLFEKTFAVLLKLLNVPFKNGHSKLGKGIHLESDKLRSSWKINSIKKNNSRRIVYTKKNCPSIVRFILHNYIYYHSTSTVSKVALQAIFS